MNAPHAAPHAAPRIIDRMANHPPPDTASEIAAGLLEASASISPKYFYDVLGCRLFQAICELDEYYVTRTEAEIFDMHRFAIAQVVGRHRQLVDLGAGDCRKAARWFPSLQPTRYVAVDVARGLVEQALMEFAADMPGTEFVGVIDDFSRSLDVREALTPEPALLFYPGSSIGNFTPDEAVAFLAQARAHCEADGSGLLIGVDLVKDVRLLERAYDDATGVTAAFNKNVLNHVNRLADADFDPAKFRHVALFNPQRSRIEMHLEALEAHEVHIDGHVRRFARGERIHTENSYKYRPDTFTGLLERAGFARMSCWSDAAGHFGVFHATP